MDEVKETTEAVEPDASASVEPLPPAAERPAEAELLDEWEKVRKLALRQLDRFMALEPKVLRGDDRDAIHDIRVASRRLQQILDLVYPAPRAREIRRLRRKIRRSRRALSEVRNCDVLLQRVEETVAGKRTSRREAWTAVNHYLRQRRSASFEQALKKLSKVNLAIFYVRLKGHLAPDGSVPVPGRHEHSVPFAVEPVAEQFHDRVSKALETVWHAFETQIAESHRDPRVPVIHGVRIAAKRLRYLIEVIHEFDVPGSADALAWLRKLQQHLGDWHDLEVLEQMMIEMVARPEFLREHLDLAMGVEKLILRNRETKKSYEAKYFQITLDSEGGERVKEWVGYLLSSPSAAFTRA